MKTISFDGFLRLRKLIYRNARPLDYSIIVMTSVLPELFDRMGNL